MDTSIILQLCLATVTLFVLGRLGSTVLELAIWAAARVEEVIFATLRMLRDMVETQIVAVANKVLAVLAVLAAIIGGEEARRDMLAMAALAVMDHIIVVVAVFGIIPPEPLEQVAAAVAAVAFRVIQIGVELLEAALEFMDKELVDVVVAHL